ncbi:uncharacterized protein LOC120478993 isoform X1 [Pimephales promelas]|uniref:uncharacterized protein LOC120478993 isoform X1 n=1 Tax=Pimephales promelas TaxID=90988 RepID=UPI001955677F|nr:uncharacterized protein LOC120478993 isoform X1 [Pimephales promelas]
MKGDDCGGVSSRTSSQSNSLVTGSTALPVLSLLSHEMSPGSPVPAAGDGFLQACVDRRSRCWPSGLESMRSVATVPPLSLGTEAGSRKGNQADNQSMTSEYKPRPEMRQVPPHATCEMHPSTRTMHTMPPGNTGTQQHRLDGQTRPPHTHFKRKMMAMDVQEQVRPLSACPDPIVCSQGEVKDFLLTWCVCVCGWLMLFV